LKLITKNNTPAQT